MILDCTVCGAIWTRLSEECLIMLKAEVDAVQIVGTINEEIDVLFLREGRYIEK